MEEIDAKYLKTIQKRFLRLSEKRLFRMLDSYNFTQSDSIKLLPLLFHVNHPMLPGYVDKSTPCGIPNYSPSNLEKKIAKTISRSFKFESRAYLKFEIAALYLMGSTGTLAQSIRSDLDLWVCVTESLNEKQIDKLRQKMDLISDWMITKGIELNCYLVFEYQFQQGSPKRLTKDDCGDTQNYLLLDEFYRTAIWLKGRMPLWWLIPENHCYQTYRDSLYQEKHIEAADWIDFGDIESIPASEYFSAALWQLYKAIESPYKSSLKLLMLEIYARFFPQTGLLSSLYKERVFQGEEDIDKLDPYGMMLTCAEDFLAKQNQRLEFLRRAFYLKAGVKIDLSRDKPRNWRYQRVKHLVEGWQWNQARLDYLNDRINWRINSVLNERVDLVRELNHSYHFIANFARVQGVLDQVGKQELVSLGRMLYATFERRADKIDNVNTGIARDVTEAAITVALVESDWHLYLGSLTEAQLVISKPVYQAASFFQLIAWAVCNRVVTRRSNYQVYSTIEFYNRELAASIARDLLRLNRKRAPGIDEAAYAKNSSIIKLGVYLNTESDPLKVEKESGIYSVANQQDGFCWGENGVNLFSQFDVFWVNSWGEQGCKSYHGDDSWVQFFIDYGQLINHSEDIVEIFGGSLPAMKKHTQRLMALLWRWHKLGVDSRLKHKTNRFIMSIDKRYLRVDFVEKEVVCKVYHQQKRLLDSLTDTATSTVSYHLDDNLSLPPIMLKLLLRARGDSFQCYLIETAKSKYNVMISEPDGAFYYQVHSGVSQIQMVSHYQQFFDSITHRLGFFTTEMVHVDYWQAPLAKVGHKARLQKIKTSQTHLADSYLPIQAIATHNSEGKVRFDLFAGEEGFHYRDYGELVYQQLVKSVMKHRRSHQNYPIFITDLDLSGVMREVTVMDYLRFKRSVEQKLASHMSQYTRST